MNLFSIISFLSFFSSFYTVFSAYTNEALNDQVVELSGLNYVPNFNQFSGYLQIPNSGKHQEIWTDKPIKNAFSSIISEDIVKDIMEVDVEDPMKILLLFVIKLLPILGNNSLIWSCCLIIISLISLLSLSSLIIKSFVKVS